jgi:D-alanine transaminase
MSEERPTRPAGEPVTEPRPPLANVDGQLLPLSEVRVSVLDRGFLFGDAVYEVLRVYRGRAWLADRHLARLGRSLREVRIEGVDVARLGRRLEETVAAGGFAEAMVYVQVTRGAAPRAHPFPGETRPLELLWVQEYHDHYEPSRRTGSRVSLQPDIRWGRCDIKSTNLLANVLAVQAAREAGCGEALLHLPDGTLTEGSHSSLFGVLDGCLRTHPPGPHILPGVTRDLVLELARGVGVPVREQPLRLSDLGRVTELFLTGTTSEVLPVTEVDGRAVGEGKPGPITRRLQEVYQEAVAAFRGP